MSGQGSFVPTDDFYPRPPRGGRHGHFVFFAVSLLISIHALREEGDQAHRRTKKHGAHISIHALREEGDPVSLVRKSPVTDFYPRPPRGGRPLA